MTDRALDYADKVAGELNAQGIRVEVDARARRSAKKIREATLGKIPYMLVVGDRDIENRNRLRPYPRRRGSGRDVPRRLRGESSRRCEDKRIW